MTMHHGAHNRVFSVGARDEVVDMFCKRMAGIHKRGKDRLEELREEHRAESERLLDVLGDVLSAARAAVDPAPAGPGRADELETANCSLQY
jgi:hypothetical protein